MGSDRDTAIQADQIKNGTLGVREFNTKQEVIDNILPIDGQILIAQQSVTGEEEYTLEFTDPFNILNLECDEFELDGNNDLQPLIGIRCIFTLDENEDIMPTISGTIDDDFEIDGNDDIMPKI